jgi:hypothetical protein
MRNIDMKVLCSLLVYSCCVLAAFCSGATSTRAEALRDVKTQIERKQKELDPGCKHALSERNNLPAQLSALTKQLCAMQSDGKKCFYEDISVEEYLRKLRPFTECESVAGLSILEVRNAQLAPALNARGGIVPELQPIATWSYPSLGSFVLPISGIQGQYIIVFNRSTFTSLLDLLKSMTAIIPITDHPGTVELSFSAARIADALDAQPDILTRVAIQLANIVANRANDVDLETLPLNTNQLLLVARSLAAVELFMLAHEYRHQHHQHFKGQNSQGNSTRYKGITIAQEREVEADVYAQELLLVLANKVFAENPVDALVYRGDGEIFLAAEGLLGMARKSAGIELEQLAAYPHPRQRLSYIVETQGRHRQSYPHLFQVDLAEPYRVAADVLWKRLESKFPQVYQAMNALKSTSTPSK